MTWFSRNARALPWRDASTTPWQVLVSEIMLQQTPAARVAPRYSEWITRWPDAMSLSQATPAQVLRQWDRLGYPNRALRLHHTARIVSSEWAGELPTTYLDLVALPGIGDYTANAILSFAYGQRSVVLDTNIRRVITRVWHGHERPGSSISAEEREHADSLVPRQPSRAAQWNIAIMEFGALLCTAHNPQCPTCPIRNQCAWRLAGYPASTQVVRTQKFIGTDRQVRGKILAVLRDSMSSLPRDAFLDTSLDEGQRNRALESLIADGLIEVTRAQRYRLPTQ